MLKLQIIILCSIVIAFFIYISDKPIIKGGSMVGKMRVNGKSIDNTKNNLRKLTSSNSLYVIDLPIETTRYLQKDKSIQTNYSNGKKFVMYTSDLYGRINCPFGRTFQNAFSKVINNQENNKYFSFYTIPEYKPFLKQKDIDKLNKLNIVFPKEYITEDEANALIDIHNTCSIFCVVNPITNHIITFSGVGQKESDSLQNLLDYIKNKNF